MTTTIGCTVFFVALLIAGILFAPQASANSLEVAPLIYRDTVKGSVKTGSINIRNPSSETITIQMIVKGFRQINDAGELEFYDDPLIAAGITPEFQTFSLESEEAITLFFEIDAAKLPKKQIFAALIANTTPDKNSAGVKASAGVGTLLLLDNGGNEVREGRFESADVPLFQLGDGISGSISYKNTGTGDTASGFFPDITVEARFFGPSAKLASKLVFPGITRTASFDLKGNYIGIYRVNAVSGDQGISRPIIVVTGWWRIVVLAASVVTAMAAVTFIRRSRLLTGKNRR